ncbi:MAG: hypothetical protein JRG91_12310 [Deltaproteobacteria bacterium]|nr:hypothetical protein [Deltaproteobacteria bacterium]
MIPQIVDLFGRRRTLVSMEFFPSEVPEDPEALAKKYHDIVEERFRAYDDEKKDD